MSGIIIRRATFDDLPAITEIYNQAVLHTVATFDTEEKTPEDRRAWFERHDSHHPVLVAELDGVVVGWAAISPWSDRPAYAGTAEGSIYLKKGAEGQGIGRKLAGANIQAGREAGLHTLIARVVAGNEASIRLAEEMGFTYIGTMKEVGLKFGRWLDVILMQLIYD